MFDLAQASTITIGSGAGYDFETIQAGIDAAVDGDTVLVAPGEYIITEPITFRGKAIIVRSEAGSDETTIRMGTPVDTNRGSVVIFENDETTSSVLDGFTITEGKGSWVSSLSAYVGGGILFNASSGTLRNCLVMNNQADDGGGGGVSAYFGSTPTLTNCTFTVNSAEYGGGVHCWDSCSLILTDCVITENSAGNSAGGVFCGQNSSVTMNGCIIRGNSTTKESGGGVNCWVNSLATLTNCIIAENTAGRAGGGVFCGENSSVTMIHCAIIGNTARTGGGMMETWHRASATVSNCVIAWNTALGVGGGGMLCGLQAGSATFNNSILWGNTAPKGREIWVRTGGKLSVTYSDVAGGQAAALIEGGTLNWGPGNIDAEPLFADPNNEDYHLKSQAGRWDPNSQSWVTDDVTSPCIDAGDPNSDWALELWPNGMRTNMGAYGGTLQASRSLSDAGNIADLNRDGIVDSTDMCIMVDNWHTDEPLCDISPPPFGDGIVDVQDLIVLAEHLFEEIPPVDPVE
ncbi:MAG: right-handed parallel beta-helix repeat-containing protein [Planctomycetota bacterium]|jgi:hypothetical protein